MGGEVCQRPLGLQVSMSLLIDGVSVLGSDGRNAPAGGVPFLTDGHSRRWCMSVFQEAEDTKQPESEAPNLDLNTVEEEEDGKEKPESFQNDPPRSKVKTVGAGRSALGFVSSVIRVGRLEQSQRSLTVMFGGLLI